MIRGIARVPGLREVYVHTQFSDLCDCNLFLSIVKVREVIKFNWDYVR